MGLPFFITRELAFAAQKNNLPEGLFYKNARLELVDPRNVRAGPRAGVFSHFLAVIPIAWYQQLGNSHDVISL